MIFMSLHHAERDAELLRHLALGQDGENRAALFDRQLGNFDADLRLNGHQGR